MLKKVAAFALKNPMVIVGVIALFSLNSLIKLFKDGDKSEVDDKMDDVQSDLTSHQASSIAERLYSAMNTAWGTDEASIELALKDLSKASFAHVYNSFGKRNYSRFFGEGGIPSFTDKIDLLGWLNNELTSSEINKLNAINPHLDL